MNSNWIFLESESVQYLIAHLTSYKFDSYKTRWIVVNCRITYFIRMLCVLMYLYVIYENMEIIIIIEKRC